MLNFATATSGVGGGGFFFLLSELLQPGNAITASNINAVGTSVVLCLNICRIP
jgi:hypothetical protein